MPSLLNDRSSGVLSNLFAVSVIETVVAVIDELFVSKVILSVVASAVAPTVKVAFSFIKPKSSCATGASLIPSMVIVNVPVSVKDPSETVYVNTSVAVSPSSNEFAVLAL